MQKVLTGNEHIDTELRELASIQKIRRCSFEYIASILGYNHCRKAAHPESPVSQSWYVRRKIFQILLLTLE